MARGTLSPLGAALTAQSPEQPDALLDCARGLLPAAAERARLGTDLTAVVAGPPTAALAALLDAAAEREARGTASVWRFTPTSVRRALDLGRTPQALAQELAEVSAAGGGIEQLPQPLAYLITDTARRHGRIRVLEPGSVLHGSDPGLLAELAAHRKLTALRLRLLAPTVLLSAADPETTLTALRAEGYAPVAEGHDGTVQVERAPAERPAALPAQRLAPTRAARPAPSTGELRALARRLQNAPDTREPSQGEVDERTAQTAKALAVRAQQLTPSAIRRLASAIRFDQTVTIAYQSPSGDRTMRTLSELEFDPPFLYAWCHLSDGQQEFALSRIQDVLPARG